VIDKLEVEIPHSAPYHPRFRRFLASLSDEQRAKLWQRGKRYSQRADLQPFGHDVTLHVSLMGSGNHKVELMDTGKHTFGSMIAEIESIYEIDAMPLRVMRVDLAADIHGVPVRWFAENVRVAFKQCQADYAVSDTRRMGRGEIQTLYFGKRPNVVRIYDKRAEYMHQFNALVRRGDASPDSFEHLFGIPQDGERLTRVERQFGGGRIPKEIQTVDSLRNVDSFLPFENLELACAALALPSPEDVPFETYCSGMYLYRMRQEHGMQAVHKFIGKHTNRNGPKVREKFAPFLSATETIFDKTSLNESFIRSVRRQLGTSQRAA
jgi:hypothetical protein